ncbi:MAG: sulfatase-like hydrolase/transferase [Verrucomicrobiales bacterium]|nr:sulfatase-like hydrolase/transferase [Verrucomicrobiales bacterium]
MKYLVLFIILLTVSSTVAEDRPDMVIFLSDDHTWRDCSVYGSTEIDTPNMKRLAEAGMTFDRAYVASPSCAPSRAALLTGLYPQHNGAEPNHARPDHDIKKLPAYLQELGYEVASFGKVGHYNQTPEYGFNLARRFGYHEDIAVSEAIDWLKNRKSEAPLCLFVGSNWPHVPWPEDTGDITPDSVVVPPHHVDTPTTREWRAKYLAAVNKMDAELGDVYDTAREVLGDDVFFLHTSDHGAQWPFAKWNLYDEGIRTPLIVSWPGKIASSKRTDAMVSWIDILPTLVDVSGGEKPAAIDGRSFLPVLTGKTNQHRDLIFASHSGDGDHNVYPSRAVIDSSGWKYIHNLHTDWMFESHATEGRSDGGYWDKWVDKAFVDEKARAKILKYLKRPAEELFQPGNDKWEQNNLATDPAAAKKLAELRTALNGWLAKTKDKKSTYGIPKKQPVPGSPNIITVFIDDMGYIDLSCFGGKRAKTLHLDQLASEGIRFKNFYVNSPICSPSRVALTTGQYPFRWKISSYLDNRKRNNERGMAQWLDPAAPVLARQLQRHGYATGHFGKWHMGGQRDVGNAPLIRDYGFDRSLTNFEGLGPRVLGYKNAHDGKEPKLHDLGSASLPTGPIIKTDRSFVTKTFVDGAIQFIDRSIAREKPFFINLWPDDVHGPWFPPKEKREKTDGSKRELHYAVVDAMDEQLAPLFDRIRKDKSLYQNTLILVCSDNGHEAGAGLSDPFRGAKTWLYEGGIRSPLIVWGPGLLAEGTAGTTNRESIFSAIDLNRSFYHIAKVPLPAGAVLDGENVAATLLGNSKESRKAPLFFRRPPDRPGFSRGMNEDNPDLAVRSGKWKYLVNYDGSDPQLYNLESDISESHNLVTAMPDLADKLYKAVFEWNATMPEDAGDPDYSKVEPLPPGQFVNPIGEGADPWVVRNEDANRYLWCFSEGNRAIAIHSGKNLSDLGTKHIVWQAPETGPFSQQVWAPELHHLNDKWYIYFAASDGENKNHKAYVLESTTKDPLGEYKIHGPLATDGWAIDMTPYPHNGKLYAIWSGWDEPGSDRQYIYIAPMKSPYELSGPRVKLAENNDFPWEYTENAGKGRGLNEAPQIIKNAGRDFLIYSCGASWLPTYKLGMLELTGRDPLNPLSWVKSKQPVFNASANTYGVGHSCFAPSPDGTEMWHVFHAKRDRKNGWRRGIHIQPMKLDERSLKPRFGRPVEPNTPLAKPSGEVFETKLAMPFKNSFSTSDSIKNFAYYGHHQRIQLNESGLTLGIEPYDPVNDFRSGEKVILRHTLPENIKVETVMRFPNPEIKSAAGILFRTTGAGLGFDAQRGYFADINLKNKSVNLGKMDGQKYYHFKKADVTFDSANPLTLGVETKGNQITIVLNGTTVLTHEDSTWSHGGIGLRTVRTPVRFKSIRITANDK